MDGNQLKQWGKLNNRFLKLEDGESITVTLKSFKPVLKDSFGEEKEVIRYVLVTEAGTEKTFDNGSTRLAEIMSEFFGKEIVITRHGEREKTKYDVREFGTEQKAVSSAPDINMMKVKDDEAGAEDIDWQP